MTANTLRIYHFALAAAGGILSLAGPLQAADTLTIGNGVIANSLCVGSQCYNDIAFGDSTLVLKNSNTRLKFVDTSSAPYPNRDWEIEANSSGNGGVNYLGINDCGTGSDAGGCVDNLVFAVEGGARFASLYIDEAGRVGFGTADPSMRLHMVDGNSPALRFEQDTSEGFGAYSWDVGGNETGYFVRDNGNLGAVVFRIRAGAPSGAFDIDSNGYISAGLGGNEAQASFHVKRADGSAKLRIEEASVTAAPRFIAEYVNNGAAAVQMIDTSGAQSYWAFQSKAGGTPGEAMFMLTNSFGPGDEFVLQADGDLFLTGTLTQGSDRNAKVAIVPVDASEILEKVSALPISAWTYRHDTSGARHLGPMAQDFYALFGLGERETGISTLDSSGVALAAIKALAKQNSDQAELIAKLAARIEQLESVVD